MCGGGRFSCWRCLRCGGGSGGFCLLGLGFTFGFPLLLPLSLPSSVAAEASAGASADAVEALSSFLALLFLPLALAFDSLAAGAEAAS